MSKKYVTVRNLDTGGVSKMLKAHAEHPVFGARVEIVPEGTKKKILIPKRITEPAKDTTLDEVEDNLGESLEKGKKVKNG